MKVEIVSAFGRVDDVLALLKEYTDMLLEQGDEVRQCLSTQHVDDELQDLSRKYAPPSGRLYLALVDGKVAGCVGLTRNDDYYCEIKRLYLRPEYRGLHLSRKLVDQVVHDAREIGYRHMRLDTFPFMESAIHLYEKYGFTYIERYNDNPAGSALFMELAL
ncbi:MAG: GNAT family N-acetyltransferase [Sutterellaceae bacterium]|nr:GNAT family N-acetyltransferase [Sutterellaceae bacterium]MDY2867659.1 GNAT family N-acetyltransferase [Mesosutterella sp.]